MPVTVTMPQLGETVTEGTILSWAKVAGDQIAEDEVLLEISTDKVDTEIPSPAAGVVQEILVAEGETVEVGAALAIIIEAGEAAAPVAGESVVEAPATSTAPEAPAPEAPAPEAPAPEAPAP
ncbi:Dihydrolipoamide acetyltransferase component of pyruvate dehydrogenase complex, partial [hydrothermal vent metagenome]